MLEFLRAGVYNSLYSTKSTHTPEKTNNWFEIELLISGDGHAVIDGKIYENKAGNLVFVKPNQRRYSTDCYTCYYIHIRTDEFPTLLNDILTVTTCTQPSLFKHIFCDIIEICQNRTEANEIFLRSKIYELLFRFNEQSRINSRASELKIEHGIISKAIKFIESNLSKNIILKDIADSVNFSPTYFHKTFTAYMGKTPHQYLLEKRISKAKHYLLTTDVPISEIAEKCGFSSFSYFDYQFKKQTGITPHKFREGKYRKFVN